jgi:polysaccharide biosynthesis transport protein
MTSHGELNDVNGNGGKARRLLPARLTGQLAPRQPHGEDQGRQLTRLTAQQLRDAPGAPASAPRFLVAHAFLILAVAIVTIGGAGVLVHSQTPLYKSQAVVSVEPAAVAASSGNPPNMATEEGVATSEVVLARAALLLNVPVAALASGVSAHSPGTTTLLQITYADPDPRIAQQRAQAIAQAYVAYRSPQSTGAPGQNPAKSTTPTAVLITPASLPTSPASPNRVLDIGIAVIVGLALGIGTALLRDRVDDHVRSVFDLEAQADAPALGLIPSFWPGWRHPRGRLVMVTKPGSIVAEAYRGLRTRLLSAGQANTKAVLVTSPGWEDKSMVAANLAVAIAQSGCSVVLVCADLRWGRAHKLFAPVNGYGLSGLLEGRTSLADALQATEVPGLRLLPPGVAPADPAALLGRFAWRMALGDMRMLADTMVIEAPPVLTGADLQPVANFTEMILLVADAKRTTRAQARLAAREVRRMRGNLVGCVLDNVGARRRLRSARMEPVAGGLVEADGPAVADSGAALTGRPGWADPDTMDFDLPQDGELAPGQLVTGLSRRRSPPPGSLTCGDARHRPSSALASRSGNQTQIVISDGSINSLRLCEFQERIVSAAPPAALLAVICDDRATRGDELVNFLQYRQHGTVQIDIDQHETERSDPGVIESSSVRAERFHSADSIAEHSPVKPSLAVSAEFLIIPVMSALRALV